MKILRELNKDHTLIAESSGDGHVDIKSKNSNGEECFIGHFTPDEQVVYQDYMPDILGQKELTNAIQQILSNFARRWQG